MEQSLSEIIKAGHSAPSADNTQPWLFQIIPEGVRLIHDKNRAMTNQLYNVDYFADFISLGASIENMRLEAELKGLKTQIRIGEKEPIVAELTFSRTEEPPSNLVDSIKKRHTN